MLSDGLASVLRSGREHFNAEFAAARRQHPELDGESFSIFLATSLDPLARAVEKVRPDRLSEVVLAAYDVGLELVALRLAGPRARQPFVDQAWQRALPAAAKSVAEAPGEVIAAVSNAVHHLAVTPGANPELWLQVLAELGPRAASADELLRLGQLLAWRAGLAHYRAGALAIADALPAALSLAALGASPARSWPELHRELTRDPWLDPTKEERQPRLAALVGRFRGFGGLFAEPPRVLAKNGQLVVISGSEGWVVTADAFGATLHRAHPDEVRGGQIAVTLPNGVNAEEGRLRLGAAVVELPLLGALTSVAFDERTLALTCSLSHAVLLVARERSP